MIKIPTIMNFNNRMATTTRKLWDYSFLLFAFLLITLFFHPVLFSNKTFFFRDIHRWFYPMKSFLSSSLQDGSIPYWCPNYFCGTPFISDLQSGVFYPLSAIFLILPFPFSFNIFILTHLLLGFTFFFIFIKGLGLSSKTALITSISYCFGGYTIACINTLNNLTTIIWLPLILFSIQKIILSNNKLYYFISIFATCSMILGGEPQIFILCIAITFLYFITSSKFDSQNIGIFKITHIIFIILLSAGLITFVQLGMTYIDYRQSARLGGITYEEASRFALNINMLKHFIIPITFDNSFFSGPDTLNSFFSGHKQIPWLLTIYPGMLMAPCALAGVLFNFSRKLFFWIILFFVSLILAMGNATPFHYFFFKMFPMFRFPVKFFFLTNFSLLIIASYGIERMFKYLKTKTIRDSSIFCLLLILIFFDLYSAHKDINPLCSPDFYEYYHPSLEPVIEDQDVFRIFSDPNIVTPSRLKNAIMDHHIKWQMMLIPNLGLLKNISNVGGVPALELRYQYLITEVLSKPWDEKIRFLQMANVKYIVSTNSLDKIPEIKDLIQRLTPLVYRIKKHLPRAYMVGMLKQVKKGTIDELTDGSFFPDQSALTSGEIINKYKKQYFHEIKKIVYKNNSHIVIEVKAMKPGILVLSESAYPGWKVFVDGKEKNCLWLNLLFQGVELEEGEHTVEFIFHPKHFLSFASISLVSFTLFVFIWLYYLFSAKRKYP